MFDLKWADFTGRHGRTRELQEDVLQLTGKRVLVTGAAGCIGGALAEAIARSCPAHLVLIDKSEQGVYELERTFDKMQNAKSIAIYLGDICDVALLDELFHCYRPQIVFHAAAFKHVPLLEQNPLAAISNNTLGTAKIVQRVIDHGCEQLLLVSTDKAADPASIMGASKRMAEMILAASHKAASHKSEPKMKIVRLGNVLNSPGSIIPLFTEQIEAGKPMTITHADVRRYFMTIEEAVAALLDASRTQYESGLFVPEMGPSLRITDVARHISQLLRPGSVGEPEFLYIPLRPGDKLEEVLIGKDECWAESSEPGKDFSVLRRVTSLPVSTETIHSAVERLRQAVNDRSLTRMISVITELIPEYRPSALLSAMSETAPVRAGDGQ